MLNFLEKNSDFKNRKNTNNIELNEIQNIEKKIYEKVKSLSPEIIESINNTGKLDEETEKKLVSLIEEFNKKITNENFWKDRKGANINSIRTKKSIQDSDVIIVKFGEKYKQWNAAFDAGFATALSKALIIMHNDEHQHALKEVDAAALAVTKSVDEVVNILKYTIEGKI